LILSISKIFISANLLLSESLRYLFISSILPFFNITSCAVPYFPCLDVLPKACCSTLKLVGKKATHTCKPPFFSNASVVLMSVPLPARLVAIITSPTSMAFCIALLSSLSLLP
jgi:hypothetical protein